MSNEDVEEIREFYKKYIENKSIRKHLKKMILKNDLELKEIAKKIA